MQTDQMTQPDDTAPGVPGPDTPARKRRKAGRGSAHDGHRKGGRHRGRRLFEYGELRLLVLTMIADEPRHGYQIIKAIEDRFDGIYSPSPGVIYPALTWLQEMGYAVAVPDGSGRKLSRITPEGEAFLTANRAAAEDLQTRRIPRGGRGRAPKPIVAAMDEIKAALRHRLAGETADAALVEALADKLRATAREIADEDAAATPRKTRRLKEGSDMDQIITRHRHELKRRTLTVRETGYLTPHMIRMVLESDDLADFTSLGADDHIKLFFGPDGSEMRDYTPRAYDNDARTLVLDFAVHDAGPATAWAVAARPGDTLNIGGPRGSAVIAPVFDWYLLIGDETALPAIGRRVEELSAGTQVLTLAAVPGPEDEQVFDTEADHAATWLHRPVGEAADPASLLDAAKALDLPDGRGFVWIAAEAQVARALKRHFLDDRGHPAAHLKAAGYWIAGTAGESEKSLD